MRCGIQEQRCLSIIGRSVEEVREACKNEEGHKDNIHSANSHLIELEDWKMVIFGSKDS